MGARRYTARERKSLKIWLELSKSAGQLDRFMDGRLRADYGQSMSRFDVLSQLERADRHTLTIGNLAAQLIASRGNITGLLSRMEDEGLLERRGSDNDRRRVEVTATQKGLKLFYDMASDHAAWASEALAGLSSTDMDELLTNLRAAGKALDGKD